MVPGSEKSILQHTIKLEFCINYVNETCKFIENANVTVNDSKEESDKHAILNCDTVAKMNK